jgi:hypothetical protein
MRRELSVTRLNRQFPNLVIGFAFGVHTSLKNRSFPAPGQLSFSS